VRGQGTAVGMLEFDDWRFSRALLEVARGVGVVIRRLPSNPELICRYFSFVDGSGEGTGPFELLDVEVDDADLAFDARSKDAAVASREKDLTFGLEVVGGVDSGVSSARDPFDLRVRKVSLRNAKQTEEGRLA
jgi:hypothetical protein